AAELPREQALVLPPLRVIAALVLAAVLLPAAATAAPPHKRLTKGQATAIFVTYPKIAHWLDRYPPNPVTDANYERGTWSVDVWSGDAGKIATGKVDDVTGSVLEAWTGPQVAWTMARGRHGSFGGDHINDPRIWLGFCTVFLLGMVDWRRPFSLRSL